MKRSIDWSLWFLIVSGVLVSIILNLGVFKWALTIVTSEGWTGFDERSRLRFDFGMLVSLFHFGLFTLLALFHYKWKNGLLNLSQSKTLVISLIVIISLIIYAGVVLLEVYFFNEYSIVGKRIQADYFLWNSLPVAAIAIAEAYFIILFKKVKASELEKAQLQEEKSNAQLAALKEQISPHFFFNTLSSLSTIVRNEKKEVGLEFIQELSKMYRYTLASERQELVELKEELTFVNAYLFIMHKRFGDKLICEMDIPELYLNKKVPPMSVQLLIENATQHNIITKTSPLTIKITVEDSMLSVENNLQVKEESEGLGLGLQNLTNRYSLIAEQDIVILKNQTTFKVKLPLL
ncbi:histidine kinase [uncultured Roseivirga sp.]|uniref:sensor histidine kinase n=1 Tax=uncultured Roseivirga sp. TaxID=543088 RepID=UPI0030DAA963|tara:strand:- start:1746 stop:2792 length:1047 start_codon:yes stop_codon:yes gene_type:complete